MYGREMHDLALDYTTQFWDTYPDVRKLMRLHLSETHENTGGKISVN